MDNNSSKLNKAKDLMVVIRELLTVTFVVLIFLFPRPYAHWSNEVNKDLKGGGAKDDTIKSPLVEAHYPNDDTQQIVAGVTAATIASLTKTGSHTVGQIQQASAELAAKLPNELRQVEPAVQNNASQEAPSPTNGAGTYGIVVSADKSDDLAEYEVNLLRKHHFDVAVYQRQNFLRTVARFSDKKSAEAAISSIRTFRSTAYVINLSKWCDDPTPSAQKIAGIPILVCAQGTA